MMAFTSAVLVALVLVPLVLSLLLAGWARLWGDETRGVLGASTQRLLLSVQAAVVVWLASGYEAGTALLATASLYAAMAAGVILLYVRRGRVDCGCWGALGGKLNLRLALFDLSMAALAGTGATTIDYPAGGVATLVVALAVLAASLIGLAMSEFIPTYTAVSDRGRRYKRWVKGFPDLTARTGI